MYFTATDTSDRHEFYHHYLINAEVLLDRVLAARASGLRPLAPALDYAAEARATVPPPPGMFHRATLEYRRWYRSNGSLRAQPLTQEALSLRLAATGEISMRSARASIARRSHALPASDQAWLIARRHIPLEQRPLNQSEWYKLAAALDGVWQSSIGASSAERVNRQITLRVVSLLGSLLDEYVASPFQSAALADAFNEHHLNHLRQSISNSRQVESDSGTLLAGPKAWFAAKAVRMRAEHQLGLSMATAANGTIGLAARPVVGLLGGRLHTFVEGRRAGARSMPAMMAVQASTG
ncbi:hypothetical protein PY254_11270 [Rhodanobacter sp. AS-Z3]|uniref:hypothetical protein n=1 Tax=Rhodanobacter sp. AS-Z3 TaxID=3031330 RepID=UPI0024796CCA|nr:hypothetical protein [Rhodanobacter sp. AS-Z3]WEN13824.1 hypothetical protein PY254_11270 [Rhodanobacter sp. AS-Z3]